MDVIANQKQGLVSQVLSLPNLNIKSKACKLQSYASLKLQQTDRLRGVECRATSVAKNLHGNDSYLGQINVHTSYTLLEQYDILSNNNMCTSVAKFVAKIYPLFPKKIQRQKNRIRKSLWFLDI